MPLYPAIEQHLIAFTNEVDVLPTVRRKKLDDLRQELIQRNWLANLLFICTHNSRRSHLAQVWARTCAVYAKRLDIDTYSGGTEVTAFNPQAAEALRVSGFHIPAAGGNNPEYRVSFAPEMPPVRCFSKRYDSDENPQRGAIAIMTCTDADEACPHVANAALRFALPYTDPKAADGTPEAAKVYLERSMEIGREMAYLFLTTPPHG
jgi:hypothetical protein